MMRRKARCILGSVALALSAWAGAVVADTLQQRLEADKDCIKVGLKGFRPIAEDRSSDFSVRWQRKQAIAGVAKKHSSTGRRLGWIGKLTGLRAMRPPRTGRDAVTGVGQHLQANGRGVDGALIDLEYQRVELIKFNLFDNQTYEDYVKGRDGFDGRALKIWVEMRLPSDHPNYRDVGAGR